MSKTCPNCSAKNGDDATFCMGCGYDLVQTSAELKKAKAEAGPKLCKACGKPMPGEALFCSVCGAKYEESSAATGGKTMFFSAMQEKGKAKLVLIRGGGFEGVSYNLNSTDHPTGRADGFILFPDDPYCSPKHCNFYYFNGKFFVSDEGSLNGVLVKIKSPVEIKDGMMFRVGEQLFKASVSNELPIHKGIVTSDDGTEFLGCPKDINVTLGLYHILEDGRVASIYYPNKESWLIGREGCDLNFPEDKFISGKHSRIMQTQGKFYLADNGSKNGTYYRIQKEQELVHGDYVFIGQQLLRVEINQ